MPVITTAKCRRQFSRRCDISVTVQNVRDFVRIFLVRACKRELRKPLRGLRVECRCFFGRKRKARQPNESGNEELLHWALSASAARTVGCFLLNHKSLCEPLTCSLFQHC